MKNKNFFLRTAPWVMMVALAAAGCKFRKDKDKNSNHQTNPFPQNQSNYSVFLDGNGKIHIPTGLSPGYHTVKTLVFQARCLQCHGRAGGVNLETYASAKKVLSRIQSSVLVEQSMPPREALTFEEMQLIRAWIDSGGYESDVSIVTPPSEPAGTPPSQTPIPTPVSTATPRPIQTPVPTSTPIPVPISTPTPSPSPSPTATPMPTPSLVRYAEVATNVFTPSCVKCHNNSRAAGDVDLSNYTSVIQNLAEVEYESLVTFSMPPQPRNKPLTLEQKNLLRTWINQGAPQ